MINTVTLNPALDKMLPVGRFEPGVTLRLPGKAQESLGGKGAHISVNLSLMGVPSRAFAILYGETGAMIGNIIAGLPGVEACFIREREGEGLDNRVNYVVIEENGLATIIAERGVELTEAEIGALLSALRMRAGAGDILVFSGDASNAGDPFIYNRFTEELKGKSPKIVIDVSGPTLAKALEARPFLIKPNRDEAESVTGIRIGDEESALKALRELAGFGIENIALTLGSEGAYVKFGGGQVLRALPAEVEVKNTSGCGDAFLSGLIAGFDRGWEPGRMVRYATAVAAATAASPLTVGFDTGLADRLAETVQLRELEL